jgi:hypothetical protein
MKTITSIIRSKNYAFAMAMIAFMIPLTYADTPNVSTATENSTSSTALYTGTSSSIFGPAETKTAMFTPVFGTEEKAKKGNLVEIDTQADSFTLQSNHTLYTVLTGTSTAFVDGEGNEISIDDLNGEIPIYVFGFVRSDNKVIQATKIVLANKAKFWTLKHSL